jgi:hypothetical protein
MIPLHLRGTSFDRASERRPCPICGKPDWCLVSDGAALCARNENKHRIGDAGWLWVLSKSKTVKRSTVMEYRLKPDRDWDAMRDGFLIDITEPQVKWLADRLQVTPQSLRDFEIGWSNARAAYTFPLQYPDREFCGFQYRTMNGAKFVATGSDISGLFIPWQIPLNGDSSIYITEGVSDAAFLHSRGRMAAARFSKNTYPIFVRDFLIDFDPPFDRVVIVADNDEDGGGLSSAQRLARVCASDYWRIGVLVPPGKDIRKLQITADEIEQHIMEVERS